MADLVLVGSHVFKLAHTTIEAIHGGGANSRRQGGTRGGVEDSKEERAKYRGTGGMVAEVKGCLRRVRIDSGWGVVGKREGIVPAREASVQICDNGFKTGGRGRCIFRVDGLIDNHVQTMEGNAGNEVPGFVRGNWRDVFFRVRRREVEGCFIWNKIRLWQVEFGEEAAFKDDGIPHDSMNEFFGMRRNVAVRTEQKLQFGVSTAQQCPSFKRAHKIEKVGRSEDDALRC